MLRSGFFLRLLLGRHNAVISIPCLQNIDLQWGSRHTTTTWLRLFFKVLLPHSSEQVFCSCWNRHLLRIQIFLPCSDASAKPTTHGLTECLTHHHDISHNTALIKELPSQQKKYNNGPILIEFTSHTMIPPSRNNHLGRMVKWPFEDSSECKLDSNTLRDFGKFTQKTVYALSQHRIYGAVSPIDKIHRSSS